MNTFQARNIRLVAVVGVMIPLMIIVMFIWSRGNTPQPSIWKNGYQQSTFINSPGPDSSHKTHHPIRKRVVDRSSLTLDEPLRLKLADETLYYNKSRGATIFTDKDGAVRIPSDFILDKMQFRDLEELYHRYLESIQTICYNQVHFGKHEDGGYDLCLDKDVVPKQPCIMYSFGVRDDFSFDEDVSEAFSCEVHSFDPANGMTDHTHSPSVFFHAMGLGDFNGLSNGWKMRTASTIKTELGHSEKSIDLMKIDIEAGEWPALPEMLSSGVLKEVKQLIMEFHSWVDLPPWNIDHRDKTAYTHHLQVLRDLYHADFRIFFFNRFPAKCCMYKDEFGIERFGCHEIHLMKVKT